MSGERTAHLLIRGGVAFAFLYPPLAALSDPVSWTAYFPAFVRTWPVDQLVLLHGFGLVEVAIALWIASGWRIRIPAILATGILAAIVFFNFTQMDVVFRDISIAVATLSLAFWPKAV